MTAITFGNTACCKQRSRRTRATEAAAAQSQPDVEVVITVVALVRGTLTTLHQLVQVLEDTVTDSGVNLLTLPKKLELTAEIRKQVVLRQKEPHPPRNMWKIHQYLRKTEFASLSPGRVRETMEARGAKCDVGPRAHERQWS